MKSVLISIQPKWCKLICSGEKTVEVRKTKPKLETPFKVYIYCTKGETLYLPRDIFGNEALNGKVIGEFVCDKIYKIYQCNSGWVQEHACISREEFFTYLGLPYNSHFDSKGAYAWNISDLKIYDKPRELSEFLCRCNRTYCTGCEDFCDEGETSFRMCGGLITITRPPQSWCYVEETE